MLFRQGLSLLLSLSLLAACSQKKKDSQEETTNTGPTQVETAIGPLELPAPFASKSAIKFSKVVGWSGTQMPTAPAGFVVTEYARDLINPRWAYIGPNGDVFVSEANTEKKVSKKQWLQ